MAAPGTQKFSERQHDKEEANGTDANFPKVLGSLMVVVLFLYGVTMGPPDASGDATKGTSGNTAVNRLYPFYIHVSIMIFVGFGFLMTFLKRYGYSAVGYNFMLSCFIFLWSMWCVTVMGHIDDLHKVSMKIEELIEGCFAAGAVMITFGSVLGKTNPSQLVILGFLEIIFYSVNFWIGATTIGATDSGGSMFVHTFGAYFGVAACWQLTPKNAGRVEHPYNGPSYTSDMTAMIGTIFLWILWPSFNGALAADGNQLRVIVNTTLSLAGSCVATFIASHALRASRVTWESNAKFDMVHVQNATLAGGVAIGTVSDLVVEPFGAILVGMCGGLLSTWGYDTVTPWLRTKFNIDDTCGVHNLHGMPGIFGALVSIPVILLAKEADYGVTWGNTFDEGESVGDQVGKQILALLITLAMALFGGALSGYIVKREFVTPQWPQQAFTDHVMWEVPDDFVNVGQAQAGERALSPEEAARIHTAVLLDGSAGADEEKAEADTKPAETTDGAVSEDPATPNPMLDEKPDDAAAKEE